MDVAAPSRPLSPANSVASRPLPVAATTGARMVGAVLTEAGPVRRCATMTKPHFAQEARKLWLRMALARPAVVAGGSRAYDAGRPVRRRPRCPPP